MRSFVAFVAMLATAIAGCVAAPANDVGARRLSGQWAGDGANLIAGDDGITIELPCAYGHVDGEVPLDARNQFEAAGTIRALGGAPRSPESGAAASQAVRYRGVIRGEQLVLTIVSPDAATRTFTLQKGAEARVPLCP
jgi:hypothetical protein